MIGTMDWGATYNRGATLTKVAKSTKQTKTYLDSPSEVQQILDKMPELTGANREKLLSVIQDEELNKIANELYRPKAEIGDRWYCDGVNR